MGKMGSRRDLEDGEWLRVKQCEKEGPTEGVGEGREGRRKKWFSLPGKREKPCRKLE